MPYKYLDNISLADAAFEVTGDTLQELLVEAAKALTNTMVDDLASVVKKEERTVTLRADDEESLLFDFLQQLIFYKDAETLLFSGYDLKVSRDEDGKLLLNGTLTGEAIDPIKHSLSADVKAVTMHKFELKKVENGWKGFVILDI